MILTHSQVKQIYNEGKSAIPQPVHWWKMNEESAGPVIDYGTGGVNGTNNGAVINQNGYKGKCYYFNGIDAFVDLGASTAAFERTDKFTLMVWGKKIVGESFTFFTNWDNPAGPTHPGYVLIVDNADNKFKFYLVNTWATNALAVLTTETFPDNVWYHFVMVYDGSSTSAGIKLYVNGIFKAHTNLVAETLSASTVSTIPLKMFKDDWGNYHGGYAQEARIYNTNLSAIQIRDIYHGTEKHYS